MSNESPASPDKSAPKATPPATTQARPPEAKFTRAAALWGALIGGFLILIVLLIFVTQNSDPSVHVKFLAWTSPSLQLGVVILLAAVGGGLLTVAVGTARIYQLRRATKKLTARG